MAWDIVPVPSCPSWDVGDTGCHGIVPLIIDNLYYIADTIDELGDTVDTINDFPAEISVWKKESITCN